MSYLLIYCSHILRRSRSEFPIPEHNQYVPDRNIPFSISYNIHFVFPSDFSIPIPDQKIWLREWLMNFPDCFQSFSSWPTKVSKTARRSRAWQLLLRLPTGCSGKCYEPAHPAQGSTGAWHAVMQFSPWKAGNAHAYDSRIYRPLGTVSDFYSQMLMFIFLCLKYT